MWVLLACSAVSVAVILERSVVYLWYGLFPDRWMKGILADLRAGKVAEALGKARKGRHPVAVVTRAFLERLVQPEAIRKEAVVREGSLAMERVEARLRLLAAIAHLAPLLGLLGTVMGMVVAFSQIEAMEGTVKPGDLAGGIWEALLTTVFGLVVAIPAMAAFHAFESHADRIARRMEWAVGAMEEALGIAKMPCQVAAGAPSVAVSSSAEEDWTAVT